MIPKPKWIKLTGKKRLFISIVLGVIILVLLGVGTFFVVRHYREQSDVSQSTQDYKIKKAELENKINATQNVDEKLDATQEITQLALDNADTQTGLKYAKKAVELSPTVNNNALLGFAAAQVGDKQLAIDAYKKAMELSPVSDDPRGDYMYFKSKQQDLEAQE